MNTPLTADYLDKWSLVADGPEMETPSSVIAPVRHGGRPAVLKLHKPGSDERRGYELLRYFDGAGAARVIEADDDALLMERVTGERSLVAMALGGQDREASEILVGVVERLHAPRRFAIPTTLTPLARWFEPLFRQAGEHRGLGRCAAVARELLDDPRDIAPLHGDIHHENVLDGGARGWLAIDPKGLFGEGCYDVANLFGNPAPHGALVHDEKRMLSLARLFAVRLGYDPGRTLRFAFAHAGLSASWDIGDGLDPSFRLKCAETLAPLVSAL